jgi:hypothetical protein
MRAAYQLEKKYGSFAAAGRALGKTENCGDGEMLELAAETREAVLEYLYALAGVEREKLDAWLTPVRIPGALELINEVIQRDLPVRDSAENYYGETVPEGFDWNILYGAARWRFGMSDKEFWDCSLRRYWALNDAWMTLNKAPEQDEEEPEVVNGPFFGA